MKNLNNMVAAPLDGSHVMIVFRKISTNMKTSDSFVIRESWMKSSLKGGISNKFEYLDDYGNFVEIEQPLGWFEIPESFDIDRWN